MGKRNFKVGDPIDVLYQAANALSGAVVIGEVFLPSGVKDSSFPDFILTERGASGTYIGSFTPDALGNWQVIVHLDDGDGQLTLKYGVGKYDVTGVGEAVEGVESLVDSVDSKVDTANTKLDGIASVISSLDTPPMIS